MHRPESIGGKIVIYGTVGVLALGAIDQFGNHGQARNKLLNRSQAEQTPTPSAANELDLSGIESEPAVAKPVIYLDPGHGGNPNGPNHGRRDHVDAQTGLWDGGGPNIPEQTEMWNVAKKVETLLKNDCYTIVFSKGSAGAVASSRQRAEKAKKVNAALAISIHDDHGAKNTWGAVYPQFQGGFRGEGDKKAVFDNKPLADESLAYTKIFSKTRSEAQGIDVVIKNNSFNGRDPLEPGNLSLVQIWALKDKTNDPAKLKLGGVPWVYSETGAKSNLSPAEEDAYALGIANGIKEAVPAPATC